MARLIHVHFVVAGIEQFSVFLSSASINHHHHLPHQPARIAIRAIPYPRNEDILHRRDLVEKVHKLLPFSASEYCSAALYGLVGSGKLLLGDLFKQPTIYRNRKTQIALDYAYQRCRNPSCSIFWVHADSEATFVQDYQAIAKHLEVDPDLKKEDLFETVRGRVEALEKWVFILDNADDLSLLGVLRVENSQSNNLSQYVPRASTGKVLWTSRDERIVGTLVGPRRGVKVGPLTQSESTKLLDIGRNAESLKDVSEATALIIELQQLPLAVFQAGAYMRRTSTPIREYLAMLQKGTQRWVILRETEKDSHRWPLICNSVLETWAISMKRIK
ncbi:hypothetical protein HJFPF1_13628 [Paramyrothecium foliicola]|nr:hypothetical protein HJFPF1_13628 [Paramyrothecium foliicola]